METALPHSSLVTLHFLHSSLKLCFWVLSETGLFSHMYILFSYTTLDSYCMVLCNPWFLSAWNGKKTGRIGYRESNEETLQGTELFKEKYSWIFFTFSCFSSLVLPTEAGRKQGASMLEQGADQLWCQPAVGLNPVKLQSRRYIAKQTGQDLSPVKHSKLEGLLSRHH